MDDKRTFMVGNAESSGASSLVRVSPKKEAVMTPIGVPKNGQSYAGNDVFELVVYWSGRPLAHLKSKLEEVSDWGPFELVDVERLPKDRTGRERAFCRFYYHGPQSVKNHYTANIRGLLAASAIPEAHAM